MKKLFRSPIARGVMIYAVLPNLALYLIGREYAIARPQVNIDYLLLWIGSCYLSRRATILLYALLFGVDLVLSTESIYHYSTLELIAVSREIEDFDPPVAYGLTGSLILILVMASIRAFRSIHVRRHVSRQRHLLAGTAAVVFLWFGNQQSMQDRANPIWESFANHSIVGSGVVEAGIAGFELVSQSEEDLYVTPAANTATAGMVHDFMTRQGPFDSYNVVVILVESQGLLNDAGDMRRVLKPLTDERIRARYIVNTGAVQFIGATMFGELRTLCRIYVPNATPSNLPELNQCLPNQLARRGFETVSYHGYHRWMYTREHWYPVLGFQRSYFLEDLLPLAPPSAKCGLGFQTLCDLWLADQVEHDLLASRARRKFLYWLTVNSENSRSSVTGTCCDAGTVIAENRHFTEIEALRIMSPQSVPTAVAAGAGRESGADCERLS